MFEMNRHLPTISARPVTGRFQPLTSLHFLVFRLPDAKEEAKSPLRTDPLAISVWVRARPKRTVSRPIHDGRVRAAPAGHAGSAVNCKFTDLLVLIRIDLNTLPTNTLLGRKEEVGFLKSDDTS